MGKKRNFKKATTQKKIIPLPVSIVEKPKNFFQKFWALLVGAGVVLTIFLGYEPIKNFFKSNQQKYEDEVFEKGEIVTPTLKESATFKKISGTQITSYIIADTPPNFQSKPVTPNNPGLQGVFLGNKILGDTIPIYLNEFLFLCRREDLKKGIKLFSTSLAGCTDTDLTIGMKDERLYVSTTFKDIEKEEIVGLIEFNHWKLYKANLLDYKDDNEKIEVRDKQNRIIFSIKFSKGMNALFISGYFVSSKSVLILNGPVEEIVTDTNRIAEFRRQTGRQTDTSKIYHVATFLRSQCISKKDTNWKANAIGYIERLVSAYN